MLADLDLKDEQEENEMLLSSLVPMMSLDPIKKGCVYIRHSAGLISEIATPLVSVLSHHLIAAGIHLLRLSWLDKLEQFSQSSDSQLPELPPSELEILLHTVPSLSGVCPICHPLVLLLFVCVLARKTLALLVYSPLGS